MKRRMIPRLIKVLMMNDIDDDLDIPNEDNDDQGITALFES